MITLRRRTVMLCLAAVPATTALPALAIGKTAWSERLQRDLDKAAMPLFDTKLRLIGFELDTSGPVKMAALVEMHWPPGMRRRKCMVNRATEDDAYDALKMALLDEFLTVDQTMQV